MIEPVALKDFFLMFFSSALVIMAGASYALLFAWSKLHRRHRYQTFAYLAYLVLTIAVIELSQAAHFSGFWLLLSAVMLIGYFFAPIGIWHLCSKTHDHHDSPTNNEDTP